MNKLRKTIREYWHIVLTPRIWAVYIFAAILLSMSQSAYADTSKFYNSESYYNTLKNSITADPNKNTDGLSNLDIEEVKAGLGIGINFGNELDFSPNNSKHRRYKVRFSVGYNDTEYYYYEANFNQAGNLFEVGNHSSATAQYANLTLTQADGVSLSSSSPINYFKMTISNSYAEAQGRNLSADVSYLVLKDANNNDLINDSSLIQEYEFTLGSSGSTVINYALNTTNGDFYGANTTLQAFVQLGNFISDYKNNPTLVYQDTYNGMVATDDELEFLKSQGIDSIRLPITWYQHMDSTGTVDPEWFSEVNRVVNKILSYGFYVVVDIHHDTGSKGWIRADASSLQLTETTYRYLVLQIAENFKDYSDHLILEGPNEVHTYNDSSVSGVTQADYAAYNQLLQIFVDEVRRTGYNNSNRILLVNVLNAYRGNITNFVLPADTAHDKLFVGIHDYTIRSNGTLASLEYFNDTGSNYLKQYHILMGEFGITRTSALQDRLNLMNVSVPLGYQLRIPMFLWDDGGGYAIMKRNAAEWDGTYDSDQVAEAMLTKHKQNAISPDNSLISLSIDNDTISLNARRNTFASGSQTITSSTTSYTGYSLYIENQGNSNSLVNTADDSLEIPSINLPTGRTSITASEFGVGYGYSIDDTNYMPLPSGGTSNTIISKTSANTTDDVTNLTMGIKVDDTVRPGTYRRTYIIKAIANPIFYTINYNPNTTGTVNNMPPTQSGQIRDASVRLSTATPTRSGYSFAGWTTEPESQAVQYRPGESYDLDPSHENTVTLYAVWRTPCAVNHICYNANGAPTTPGMSTQSVGSNTSVTLWASNFKRTDYYGFAGWNTEPDGSGTYYGPNETFTTGDLSINGMNLYAIWVPSAGNLQDWSGCSTLPVNTVTALTDSRDLSTYAVAKLADGNCWMTENLRLGTTSAIDSTNTNNPASGFAMPATSSSWCSTDNDPCINSANLNNTNTSSPVSTMSATGTSIYSYGNYYNWYAATAGNGTRSMTSDTPSGDICPKGWQLPTASNTSGGYAYLAGNMNSGTTANNWRKYPYNYLYSGGIAGSSITARGNQGFYITANPTATNAINRFYIAASSTTINYTGTTPKASGRSVRCTTESNTKYTVIFDANGGSGSMPNQQIISGASTTLNPNQYTKTDFSFGGWNTEPDGTGTSYANQASVTDLAPIGGSITLYAQWTTSCGSGSICYNSNGASSEITMDVQTADVTNTTLWAPNFKRSGYGFAGWNTMADGSGTYYGPNETIATSSLPTDGLQLYAIWIQSTGNLQDWGGCSVMTSGSVTALTDIRDSNTYAVAKLADGNCWMTENLRLGATSEINSTNTNNPASGFTLSVTSGSWCNTDSDACINAARLNSTNTTNPVSAMNMTTGTNTSIYSYGNYYNWYAATAGNGTRSITSGTPSGDICPKGWQLPTTNNTSGGYDYLANNMSGGTTANNWRKYPYNYLYSGGYSGSSITARGNQGFYITANATGTNAINRLYLNASDSAINYTGTTPKANGRSVRCVKQ